MFFLTLLFLLDNAYPQINLDINDLELEDVQLPSFEEIKKIEKEEFNIIYPSDITAIFETRGGIHEKFPPNYFNKITEETIAWNKVELPSKNESYYLYFSLGYGTISYKGTINSSDPSLNLNLLGIYWPKFNQNFYVGFILDLTLNELSVNQTQISIYQPALSLSMNYFLGKNIGSGFFFRLDFGFSSVAYLKDEPSQYVLDYMIGASMLGGIGFAFPLSSETRLLLNIDYGRKMQTYNNQANGSDFGILTTGLLF